MASELLCMPMPRPYLLTNKLTTSISPPLISTFRTTPSFSPAIRCSSTAQSSHLRDERGSADYQPTIWSFDFVQSLNNHHLVEKYEDEVKKLEEEVKVCMVNDDDDDDEDGGMLVLKKLEFVDDIQRLGLGYRFEEDIRKALDEIQGLININPEFTEKSLHTAALCFRLLRQHGYEISQDIFKSFKDENGSFKECLCNDLKGMLSLYEASYLAFEGEDLMDEAKAFTTMHLQNQKDQNASNISLAKQVSHALELPLHHTMQRLEARWYIDAYSKRSDANQLLLQLAKLDFNMVQSTLQTDLKDMSRWWKGLGLANKLSFTRDRLMECFFWAVGMVSEPQYSNLRKGLTKVASFITVIDDVYDVYGTLDELELFTNAVERWDVNAVKILPDYMKLCFLALYNTVNEMAYETLKEQGQNILPYLTKAWADMFKAFLKEAKWSRSKHTPTFEEYLENGWVSVSGVVLLVHAYFLLSDNIITKQGIECLQNYHNLLRWPSMIFRLSNDMGTSTAEIQRGETANSITCSMRENDLSEECARRNIYNLMEETWKKMNKEIVASGDSPLPKTFVDTALNLARISQCTYQYGDGHGAPDKRSKNRVLSLLIYPIL